MTLMLFAFGTPAAADAATRHITPTGGVTTGDCNAAAPCTYEYVFNGAGSVANDTVIAAPGTYDLTTTQVQLGRPLDIRGTDGQPRPLFKSSNNMGLVAFLLGSGSGGTKFTHVAFEGETAPPLSIGQPVTIADSAFTGKNGCLFASTGSVTVSDSEFTVPTGAVGAIPCVIVGTTASFVLRDSEVNSGATTANVPAVDVQGASATIEDVVVTSAGDGVRTAGTGTNTVTVRRSEITAAADALEVGARSLVTDTLARSTGTNGKAVTLAGGRIRHVTAVATGTGSVGIDVPPQTTAGLSSNAVNVVARGVANDVVVHPDGLIPSPTPPGDPICMIVPIICAPTPGTHVATTISRSNFGSVSGTLEPASAGNTGTAPGFVDAAAGDFHLASGSSLIDAGVDDVDSGLTDLDGRARKIGSATDIGAYEYEPPAEPPPAGNGGGSPPPTGGGNPSPPVPPSTIVDRLAPNLSALELTNKTFAVAAAATPVAARAKKGTTFVYRLSEPARVAITIEKATAGRRSGSKCQKPSRKNRKGKKCTIYKKAGTLTRTGAGGANALAFSGRLGRKALSPASYRATFAATDAAGNASAKRSAAFKIVKK